MRNLPLSWPACNRNAPRKTRNRLPRKTGLTSWKRIWRGRKKREADLARELAAAQAHNSKQDEELRARQAEWEDLRSRTNHDNQRRFEEQTGLVERQAAELEATRARVAELSAAAESARQRESELTAQLDTVQARHAELAGELANVQSRRTEEDAELAAARDRANQLEADLAGARKREADLARELAAAQAHNSKQDEELRARQAEWEALRNRTNQDNQRRMEEQAGLVERQAAELEATRARLAEFSAAAESARQRESELTAQLDTVQSRHAELAGELASVQAQTRRGRRGIGRRERPGGPVGGRSGGVAQEGGRSGSGACGGPGAQFQVRGGTEGSAGRLGFPRHEASRGGGRSHESLGSYRRARKKLVRSACRGISRLWRRPRRGLPSSLRDGCGRCTRDEGQSQLPGIPAP